MNRYDYTGKRFGRLTVLRKDRSDKHGHSRWVCRCDCGRTKVVDGDRLKRGYTQSCGCLAKELARSRATIHGMFGSPLYKKWTSMIARCKYKGSSNYKYYGAQGITVYEEWQDFQTFREWALRSGYKDGLSLERKDISLGYTPQNCLWIPLKDQQKNKRTSVWLEVGGERKILADWARDTNQPYERLKARHNRGWSDREVVYGKARQ